MTEEQKLIKFYREQLDKMHKEVTDLRKKMHEQRMDFIKLQERSLDMLNLAKRNAGINPETDENDERSMDEIINSNTDKQTLINGIVSQAYRGRLVSVRQSGDGALHISFTNNNLKRRFKEYKGDNLSLSIESFVLIMEAMEFAAKKFGIDRKKAIESLTGGDVIDFKDAITVF